MSIFKFTTYSGKTCQVNGSQYLEDFTETASNVLTSSDWISEKSKQLRLWMIQKNFSTHYIIVILP